MAEDKYVGKRLDGRYEIEEIIGEGGMAVVYSATDIQDGIPVAIKILRDEYLGNNEFIRRFKDESKAIAVLSHPNIVKVYDVSFGDRIQYIVMEYIDGITLKDYIEKTGPVDWKETVHFVLQTLKALQHAHEKGIIHRDVKPQNIMLLEDGTIKVTDFGIARFSKSTTNSMTMTNKAIGSVHYVSPEQARGEPTDAKSDLYSLGVMLYEMLTGKLPFDDANAVSVALMQLQSDPEPPRNLNPDIPVGLEEIIIKAMQKDPNKRYHSAAEMYNDILKVRKNPSITFNYNYDDIPIRDDNSSVNTTVRTIKKLDSDSDYNDPDSWDDDSDDEKRGTNSAVQVVIGAVAAFVIVCLVFLVLAVFKGLSSNSTTDVLVPNLIGLYFTDVNKDKVTYNFKWDVKNVYDADKPLDVIISQDPQPSEKKIKEGSTIQIVVNSEETVINLPNVDGRTKDDAVARMKSASLVPEVLMVLDNETAEGYVKQTYPASGSKITIGSPVKIYVSKKAGKSKKEVPNLVGLTLSEAQNKIAEAGLTYNGFTYMESTVAKDKIVAQNPLRGAKVDPGANVSVILSEGPPRSVALSQTVDLPADIASSIKFEVIIDGEVDKSYTKPIVPKYARQYTLTISRMSTVGSIPVVVALNEHTYRVYKFDFKNSTVTTEESYPFVLDTDLDDTETETDTETDMEHEDETDTEIDTESSSVTADTDYENYDDTEDYNNPDLPTDPTDVSSSEVVEQPDPEPNDGGNQGGAFEPENPPEQDDGDIE
ncbi:MAG: Stk1 family PASTA domain-containing Ser/Thr kinase [Clostridia bacterium]|nr:Stk1 family PASTA domain-containing Ser/Thr kinase [Clostridia bacterium]